MAFPDVPRVIYGKNPLQEVICQLRFPPVLRIDAEPPAAFQEQIRADYPFYESKSPLRLPAGLPANLAQMLVADLPLGGLKSHDFDSNDRIWSLNLTREFLALTCRAYERWENFRERLKGAGETLNKHYNPPFFTRIGLRYRDVIRRSRLQLAETPWSELLQPWVSGVLGSPETAERVKNAQSTFLIELPEEVGQLQVSSGLAVDGQSKEIAFLIDADFYTQQQTEPSDVFKRLNILNRYARTFFRWCITDRLHEAMRPRPVASD
ncbi:MAG: TIGR04255 family protein [Gemmataceae bacterium]